MSEVEPIEEVDTSGLMDYPNREALGLEHPAVTAEAEGRKTEADPLDSMTKAELIEEAEKRGIEVDDSLKKDEIREALG